MTSSPLKCLFMRYKPWKRGRGGDEVETLLPAGTRYLVPGRDEVGNRPSTRGNAGNRYGVAGDEVPDRSTGYLRTPLCRDQPT
jgi:hypothetical protein